MESKRGKGNLQWNRNNWFGGQIGSSCWMLMGFWYIEKSPILCILFLSCFFVINIIGTVFWSKRDKLDPYISDQAMNFIIWTCFSVIIVGGDSLGELKELASPMKNPRLIYFFLLLPPFVMLRFYYINKSNKTHNESIELTDKSLRDFQ